jgi:photosystem II cytochrome c550
MFRSLLVLLLVLVTGLTGTDVAAAKVDSYVANYLHVHQLVALPFNDRGETVQITPEDLSEGKHLFESNCLNCHVGGATLPNPSVTLSLTSLQGATPPRDTIASLMAFQRQPLTYDGLDESYECRRVSSSWMDDRTLQTLSAFILQAARTAPGWGADIMKEAGL